MTRFGIGRLRYRVCVWVLGVVSAVGGWSCSSAPVQHGAGEMAVVIEPGENWLHDFKLPLGLQRKNAPQLAVWLTDTTGRYLKTLYVTQKTASQGWLFSGGSRRPEALPRWSHTRGVRYEDGLYLPTRRKPLSDAVTGATPRGTFRVRFSAEELPTVYMVWVEVNHSTDFNDAYPREAEPDAPGWSGGRMGSGQPAVVYAAKIDSREKSLPAEAELVGHSAPDGADGSLCRDVSELTSALKIVRNIAIVSQ